MIDTLQTARLVMRRPQGSDRDAFAAMNADPAVMEFFPSVLTRAESDEHLDRIDAHFREYGFGWWILELRATGEFLGCTGLMIPRFDAHFTPCVEVGWRLKRAAWGSGYAVESATAALHAGFFTVGLEEIVSFTVPANARSRRVMERLGMSHDPREDFSHPRVPVGHPLQHHVLYRLPRQRHSSLVHIRPGQ